MHNQFKLNTLYVIITIATFTKSISMTQQLHIIVLLVIIFCFAKLQNDWFYDGLYLKSICRQLMLLFLVTTVHLHCIRIALGSTFGLHRISNIRSRVRRRRIKTGRSYVR
jgi:hypothetical protein